MNNIMLETGRKTNFWNLVETKKKKVGNIFQHIAKFIGNSNGCVKKNLCRSIE